MVLDPILLFIYKEKKPDLEHKFRYSCGVKSIFAHDWIYHGMVWVHECSPLNCRLNKRYKYDITIKSLVELRKEI